MAFSTAWRDHSGEYDRRRLSGNARRQRLFGGALLGCVALACAWSLWANLGDTTAHRVPFLRPTPSLAANAYAKLSAALKSYARRPALQQDVSTTGSIGDQAARSAASPAQQLRSPPTRTASLRAATPASRAGSNTPADKPTIFERLFGKPATTTLAYASPDDSDLGGQGVTSGRYDRSTAVYDISAHTVYLPDGTKLEAHSGYGSRLDDPRHADERMRGVTPPTVYELKPRESPFHGVQALRLIPVDEDKVFGRTGLLAHTFMLGPRGDSNGCVSFRNSNAFLHAYESHQIKRLVVVSRLE
jgi:hypothetical protein